MVYTLYVGKSEQTIYHFRSLLKDDLVVASDHAEAERKIHEKREDQPLMIFYERGVLRLTH